jgi:prephenate dehydrogenase
MEESQRKSKVVLVGLGLIGGSLGLALKSAGLANVWLVGHDTNHNVASKAKQRGAVDETDSNLIRAVRDAALVVVAVPIGSMRRVFEEIAPHVPENAIVTDTASSKLEVMKWAADILPGTVNFVGGHPMAGKEQRGIEAADANLFRDATYCISPLPSASEGAVHAVLGFIQGLGARPWFVDPEEHDRYAAAISHMPMILANALFTMVHRSKAWVELSRMAGPGFKDMTRLASQDPEMELDIVTTNQESIVHWIDRMQEELGRWKEIVQSDEETAFQALYKANLDRDEYILNGPKELDFGASPAQFDKSEITDMLVGARWAQRLREITRAAEDKANEPRRRRA